MRLDCNTSKLLSCYQTERTQVIRNHANKRMKVYATKNQLLVMDVNAKPSQVKQLEGQAPPSFLENKHFLGMLSWN